MTDNITERIRKNNEELKSLHIALPKTLSRKVLERFMSAEDLEGLSKAYTDNKLNKYYKDRSISLNREISDNDMVLLNAYFGELETQASELEKRFEMRKGSIGGTVRSIAIRFLFQNKDLVGL